MATYMSAVGGIFIGFGVLISKKERNAIEEQMTSVNAFLTPKPYDDAALAVKKICATDLSAIQLMANDLLALSKSFEVAGNNMRDASKSLNEIHKSQMKMAHGAQTWLLIGVFISFISSLFLTLFPLVTK
ncbi:hypothetical protein DZB54_01065 [Herbaspirillum sp. 3R-3a1]|nr:hypothetical protein DZB54_01065 [Herbaspirillum sp. 3R-3a1]